MRSFEEVLTSVQHYVSEALPDDWNVVRSLEHETPDRPFAVVTPAGNVETSGLTASPISEVPIAVYAYPPKVATRAEAEAAEHTIADLLWSAFVQGIGAGREMRVPLWHLTGRPEVQRLDVPPLVAGHVPTWRIGYDGQNTSPLARRAQPKAIQTAIAGLIPDMDSDPPRVTAQRLGGPYYLIDDGPEAGRAIDLASVQANGGAEVPAVRLQAGSPDPWRDPREFVTVSQVVVGGQDDDEDPTMRRVNVSMRASWGRPGRPTAQGPLIDRVTVTGTGS